LAPIIGRSIIGAPLQKNLIDDDDGDDGDDDADDVMMMML